MNKKLSYINTLIRDGKGVIDVGTDHGFIPISLASRNYPGTIIATDISALSLNRALDNAKIMGVYEKIIFLQCDGLSGCDSYDIDTIIISGIGGDNICSILDNAEWCWDSSYSFIFHAASKTEVLRYFLVNNGFEISAEHIIEDKRKLYSIIETFYTGENQLYSDAECIIGRPDLVVHGADKLPKLIEDEIAQYTKLISSLKSSDSDSVFCKTYFCILNELKALETII